MTLQQRHKQLAESRDRVSPMRGYVQPRKEKPSHATPREKPTGQADSGPAAGPTEGTVAPRSAAAVADPAWVSAYASAYPEYLSIGGQLKFGSGAAASYSGLWMYVVDEGGTIVFDQEVNRATGDPTGKFLENGAWCYGWWADKAYPADQCFWWSSNKLGGHLKDGKKYYAWIFLKGTDGSYGANGTTSGLVQAFYTPGISNAQSGTCTCYAQTRRADPINTATGVFTERFNDALLGGSGVPLSLDRYYRSDSSSVGLLGKGWTTPFDSKLTVASSSVTYQTDDGAKVVFAQAGNGTYTAPAGTKARLAKTGIGYTLITPDQIHRSYTSSGQLTSLVDISGHGLTLSYSAGELASVTDAGGRTTDFSVDANGLLTKVTLPDSTSVTYGHTGGLLTSVTDRAEKKSFYGYDGSSRLDSVTDPAGGNVTNVYDSSGRVTSQTDQEGKVTTFVWGGVAGSRETDTTDANGGVWTDVYSGNVLLRSIDPYGHETAYTYDRHLRQVEITDARGNSTDLAYDSAGHVLSYTPPASLGYSESWTYNAAGNALTYTDGRGDTTTYEYNSVQQLTSSTNQRGGQVRYEYNSLGALESITSARGKATTFGYDAAGNRTSVTTPLGYKTTFEYDSAGRVTAQTDPRGNTDGADAADYTTHYAYDARGLLEKSTDPLGHSTSYHYDDTGLLSSVEDQAGRTTSYEYDDAGRLTKTTAPAGRTTVRKYDNVGNLLSETNALGHTTSYTYDKANRLSSMTTPRGNVAGADASAYTTTYGYDANGNRTQVVDPAGAKTTTTYDALNRATSVTDPLLHVTKTGYDKAGNVASTTDALGKTTKYTYDDAGHALSRTDPLGEVTAHGYDADGNTTSELTPVGRKWTWSYDADGRQASQVDPRGNATGATAADYTTVYGYDAAGNRTSVTDPYGNQQSTEYNSLNQLTAVQDAAKHRTTYAYDDLSRIKTVTAPDDGTTSYTYDTAGNIHTRTDANQHVTTYGYDALNQLTSVTDPLKHTVAHHYDPDGNNDTTTDARGIVTTVTFDALGRPTATEYSDGTHATSTAYDTAGNTHQITDASGTRTFTYDKDDRLTGITMPNGKAFAYKYDDAGRLTERTYPDGQLTAYTYTADGDQDSATTNGAKTTITHTSAHLPLAITYPNGYTETRSYDRAFRLTDIVSKNATKTLSSRHNVLDGNGRPVRVDAAENYAGTTTANSAHYTYDASGRLLSNCTSAPRTTSCPSGSPTTSYTYDQVGNRLTQTSPDGTTTTYKYNEADELFQRTNGTATTSYTYDADGNQTTDGIDTLAYDATNHLKSKGATNYTYDADGNLTSRSKGGLITAYTWDINNGLPQLAMVGSADFTYNELGQVASTRQAAGTFYYHHDLMGSITDLTSASGADTSHHAFGAFGENSHNLNGGAEDTPNSNFGFTGAYTDQTIQNDYDAVATSINLRARNYDPDTGRFTSRDPLAADPTTPYQSAYNYANNAPTYLADPSGKCWWIPNSGSKSCWTTKIPGTDAIPLAPSIEAFGNSIVDACKSGAAYAETNGRWGWTGCVDEFTGVNSFRKSADCISAGAYGEGALWGLNGIGTAGLLAMPEFKGSAGLPSSAAERAAPPSRFGPGAAHGGDPALGGVNPYTPLGFTVTSFGSFKRSLYAGLDALGYRDTTAVFHGSSVTGQSYRTGDAFGAESDYDIALAGHDLMEKARKAGIRFRSGGTRTGPLREHDLRKLRLGGLADELSGLSGHKVAFMLYETVEDATARGASLIARR
ncbi:DUF6531 domain-containing protein [Streptomyces coelicoflavus]|uniref:DUF6531 domain-containing protein n=2 Tax=Streptomyces coelicoflavus TaxID=285562 RepID=UPI0036A184B6